MSNWYDKVREPFAWRFPHIWDKFMNWEIIREHILKIEWHEFFFRLRRNNIPCLAYVDEGHLALKINTSDFRAQALQAMHKSKHDEE